MAVIFDATKNRQNIARHGVSLAGAAVLDWNSVLAMEDRRSEYAELREIGYGLLGDRLYCVAFVRHAKGFRIISFRKANSREIRRYVRQIEQAEDRGAAIAGRSGD
jgi:uncharacterized DUF497 family protein